MGTSTTQKKPYVLGLDVGSTGTLTSGLFKRKTGTMLASGNGIYHNRRGLPIGYVEHNPIDWWWAAAEAIRNLKRHIAFNPTEVAGIGLDAHMHAATLLQADKKPITIGDKLAQGSINWDDCRGQAEAEALRELWDEPIVQRLTASRISWLLKNRPELWDKVAYVAVPSSAMTLWLTGVHAVGVGDASGMFGQLDADNQICRKKAESLQPGLYAKLPRVVPAGVPAGYLTEEAATALGLIAGIPVAAGEGDQPIGMIASGVFKKGQASISLGNSAVFNAVAETPILNRPAVVDPFRTADGRHFLMTCATSGTKTVDELVQVCTRDREQEIPVTFSALTELAKAVPAGCNGIMALPFIAGEGVFELPDGFGSFLGVRQGKNQLDYGTRMRATLEGSTMVMLSGLAAMNLSSLEEIVVSGGGAQNPLWLQIIASAFNARVRYPLHGNEAGTCGAAYLAETMVRKLEGDSSATLESVAGEYVELSDPIQPIASEVTLYSSLLPQFQQAVQAVRTLTNLPHFALKG